VRLRWLWLVLLLAAPGATGQGATAAVPTPVQPEISSSGTPTVESKPVFRLAARVNSPTALTYAPGPKKVVFLTERRGLVRVLHEGKLLKRPFLDIRNRVSSKWIEQGLLGIAFPPDYLNTRRFYLFYTALNGDIRIDEFKRSPSRQLRANPASRRTVLRIPELKDGAGHNGGAMRFLHQMLFVTIGDGGNPGDEFNQAQDLTSLRGKILRIDPRPDPETGGGYRSPADNPFANGPGRDEIFAYGLRNPHALSIHRNALGEPHFIITDVGQRRYEEVNHVPLSRLSGANFGWKMYEGLEPYNCGPALCPNGDELPPPDAPPGTSPPGTSPPALTWPVFVYPHSEGCAVIGGPVIRDPALGELTGRWIAGDFCVKGLHTFNPGSSLLTDRLPLGAFPPSGKGRSAAINGFGEDAWGRVYVFDNHGGVYRLALR
jgi:glucose/arabinose dehydrogenase